MTVLLLTLFSSCASSNEKELYLAPYDGQNRLKINPFSLFSSGALHGILENGLSGWRQRQVKS
jgi:hypothetical protein